MNTPSPEAIDLYCERTSAAFWAEPVNALSNLSFVVAALGILLLCRQRGIRPGWQGSFLIGNLALIGVGSFLFHTFANRLTMAADLLPIFIYQLAFISLYLRDVAACSWRTIGGLLAAFLVINLQLASLPRDWLNGSLLYGGALLFMAGLALHHLRRATHEPGVLLWATALFCISLTCRSLDNQLCALLPLGTHFLWHLLNGIVLYLTTRAFLLNRHAGGNPRLMVESGDSRRML